MHQMPAMLVGTAAEGISLADLTAYAGAYAVRITGGPVIKVAFGRQDVTSADPEVTRP
jgi:L-ascorbate peroxidase